MPDLTIREWLLVAGIYLIGWAIVALIQGFIRGWRGPNNRDLVKATTIMTNWMVKANRGKKVRVRSITVYDTGQVDSRVYRNPLVDETREQKDA